MNGNYSNRIEQRFSELTKIRLIYDSLRSKGLDLYEIERHLIALPDAPREKRQDGEGLVMTEGDWKVYFNHLLSGEITYAISQKNNILNSRLSETEQIIHAHIEARNKVERMSLRAGGILFPFKQEHDIADTFSLKKLEEAVAGGFPEIQYETADID